MSDLSPEFFNILAGIFEQNGRICAMWPREADCLRCGERIRRTTFNGNPVWEHETPLGERHDPWARTHCKAEPGHECPTSGCDRHAQPNPDQLFSPGDRILLSGLRITL